MADEISLSKIVFILHGTLYNQDSRPVLEKIGVSIVGQDNGFYLCKLPEKWTTKIEFNMLFVYDENGNSRAVQYLKHVPQLNID